MSLMIIELLFYDDFPTLLGVPFEKNIL